MLVLLVVLVWIALVVTGYSLLMSLAPDEEVKTETDVSTPQVAPAELQVWKHHGIGSEHLYELTSSCIEMPGETPAIVPDTPKVKKPRKKKVATEAKPKKPVKKTVKIAAPKKKKAK